MINVDFLSKNVIKLTDKSFYLIQLKLLIFDKEVL